MSVPDEFDRSNGKPAEEHRYESGQNGKGGTTTDRDSMPASTVREPAPRTAGSPLPMGSSGKLPGRGEGQPIRSTVPPPGRTLSVSAHSDPDASSGMQWAMGIMKQAVPFVQKLLPLLDGQVAAAVANLITARPHTPPPAPRVDLQPIEHSIANLQNQQLGLKDQLADQNTSLKRVEDQLEMVREATDRNTLEQQELIEDLKAMGNRVNLLALLFLGLLVISVLLNLFLFLHIQRVLP